FFFFQAEDGIRDRTVTGVQTCALPISARRFRPGAPGAGAPVRSRSGGAGVGADALAAMRKDGLMSEPVEEKRTVVVVGPDGQPVGTMQLPEQDSENPDGEDPGSLIQQPAKVMRIGSMIKQLLEEVRAAPLDEAGRQRLTEI